MAVGEVLCLEYTIALLFLATTFWLYSAWKRASLRSLLCKKQLSHACLEHSCVLTKPLDSSYLDLTLLAMLMPGATLVDFKGSLDTKRGSVCGFLKGDCLTLLALNMM